MAKKWRGKWRKNTKYCDKMVIKMATKWQQNGEIKTKK